jgi:adenosine 3'-phospho 5'-phosphosulfate transporter B3
MMLMGKLWFGKQYIKAQYAATVLMLLGICFFSLADITLSSEAMLNFQIKGILIMLLSITSEALGQHYQEEAIAKYNCSEREMVFANSVIGTGILAIVMVVTGEIGPAFNYCVEYLRIYLKIGVLSVLGYLGAVTLLTLIKSYGLFIAMSVANTRKLFTIVLSFLMFPKPFSFTYVVASGFAFAGIGLNIYIKNWEEVHILIARLFGKSNTAYEVQEKEEFITISRGD